MRSWTMFLAIVAAMLIGDVAFARGRRCGGRRHRGCGYVASPCAGGACYTGGGCAGGSCTAGAGYVGGGGYASLGAPVQDWTYGYPGVGYTGYGYTTFAGYPPGALYGVSR